MHAFTNWRWYQERAECNDWSERPGAQYCNWDGVRCNAAGQVTEVIFLKNGSYLTGDISPHHAPCTNLSNSLGPEHCNMQAQQIYLKLCHLQTTPAALAAVALGVRCVCAFAGCFLCELWCNVVGLSKPVSLQSCRIHHNQIWCRQCWGHAVRGISHAQFADPGRI